MLLLATNKELLFVGTCTDWVQEMFKFKLINIISLQENVTLSMDFDNFLRILFISNGDFSLVVFSLT